MVFDGCARGFVVGTSVVVIAFLLACQSAGPCLAEVKAWEDTLTIPTYPWSDDVNPKFWALEGGPRLSTTVKGAITYPYTMQDHLSRDLGERTYKALCIENEYLKVTCLPELGGRLHSVLDKTTNQPMFHENRVIKPGMIAMRGAWISGGVEWNFGPHGHTVTCVSPVDALIGKNDDGSAFLEISNVEKIFRTRWTVRVTLHPRKAYLDEQIRIFNPTEGTHPYYFWNCTAFPNLPGTRFIYPMSLGTDHYGREFFRWPVDAGKDLTWLKNYATPSSVFAVGCDYDFFGAYDVDLDRGIVQVANRHQVPGKKAWTWSNSEHGQVAQQNLTDTAGPYIEVQSGPLPTQSDYGMLLPRQQITWREWWYPVHGLGDGFEFATKDLAVHTARNNGNLELRLLATGNFPKARWQVSGKKNLRLEGEIDLSPGEVPSIVVPGAADVPVAVHVTHAGEVLASFTTPLPIPEVRPPDPSSFEETPDDQLSAESKYLKGRKFDRATDRAGARTYYELALADDAAHLPSLRALAVLDLEAGLYAEAAERLESALDRDPDDGLCWYTLGVCRLRQNNLNQALRCGYEATKHFGTLPLGYDLVGRASLRLGKIDEAFEAFNTAAWNSPFDWRVEQHLQLALYAKLRRQEVADPSKLPADPFARAANTVTRAPTSLVSRAMLALRGEEALKEFVDQTRGFLGEHEFNMVEVSLVFAEVGLVEEATRLLEAACVDLPAKSGPGGEAEPGPLPLYYLAYYASLVGKRDEAAEYLKRAGAITRDFVFPSRPEAIDVFAYAVAAEPTDANAHLHLGNLYANLGRVEEAVGCWQQAVTRNPRLAMAWRNLGLVAASKEADLAKAEAHYRKAVAARPEDQTLHRDLAEILLAAKKPAEAIGVLETIPLDGNPRADVILMLAQAYFDQEQLDDTIGILASTPYFINWEGQDAVWVLFNKAHVLRGRRRLEKGQLEAALEDLEAARTYPKNLGVGRSDEPQEAAAQYWRGKVLAAMGRAKEARAAWKEGAAGHEGSDDQNTHRELCQEALAQGKQ